MNIVTGSGNVASKPPLPGSGETKSSVKGYLEPIRGRGLRATGTELRRVLDEAVKVTWQGHEGMSGGRVTDLCPPPLWSKGPIAPAHVGRL